MIQPNCREVLVVVADEAIDAALQEVASRHAWPVLIQPTQQDVMRHVHGREAQVIVIQLSWSPRVEKTLRMIESLCQHWQQVLTIAAASEHGDELETKVRAAGATCYLAPPINAHAVNAAVANLLKRPAAQVVVTGQKRPTRRSK